MIKITGRRIVAAMLAALGMCSGLAMAASATVRLDYQHGGNAKSEHYAMERVVIEPLPWPGNPVRRDSIFPHFFTMLIELRTELKATFAATAESIIETY